MAFLSTNAVIRHLFYIVPQISDFVTLNTLRQKRYCPYAS